MNPTLLERLALLSPERQSQVLDFINELLLTAAREEEVQWSSFSMQVEQSRVAEDFTVEYGLDDLREHFT